jgi:hypothetical protein
MSGESNMSTAPISKSRRVVVLGRGIWISAVFLAAGCTSPSGADNSKDRPTARALLASPTSGPVTTIEIVNGQVASISSSPAAPVVRSIGAPQYSKPSVPALVSTPEKIDPGLSRRISAAEAAATTSASEQVVVTFVETQKHAQFSPKIETEPHDSTANQQIFQSNKQVVAAIQAARASEYSAKSADILAKYNAKTIDTFWLINGMIVSMPIGQIRALAARDDVQYVELDQTDIPPPANQASDVRALLNTDPYFAQTSTTIAILDTGVRSSHTLLLTELTYFWIASLARNNSAVVGQIRLMTFGIMEPLRRPRSLRTRILEMPTAASLKWSSIATKYSAARGS